MQRAEIPLRNLKIASPCSADWNAMKGDERKRFCGECKLNVYNLSGMTSYDAENLLRNAEGRLCVRYYLRPDGTVLTQDCPVGWARLKRRVSIAAASVFAVLITMVNALFLFSVIGSSNRKQITKLLPIPFSTPTPEPLMGAIPMPSPKPTPKPTPKETPKDRPVMGKIAPIKG